MDAELERKMKIDHYEHYEQMARHIGPYLRSQVRQIFDACGMSEEIVRSNAERDPHLNFIPLPLWDRWMGANKLPICRANRAAGRAHAWSLSDNTCTLKHVARHWILGFPKPE